MIIQQTSRIKGNHIILLKKLQRNKKFWYGHRNVNMGSFLKAAINGINVCGNDWIDMYLFIQITEDQIENITSMKPIVKCAAE